ncbi:hypothetical protein AB0G00_32880 [Nocardia salmonicida]|uniref:hypothetical protein n=1 Tax=Nocardia salmonicida TaxID=53431 RepID=UPI0033E8D61C
MFCDYAVIEAPGYKTLHAGQLVVFAMTHTGRGHEARRVLTYGQPSADIDAATPTRLPRSGARSPWSRQTCCLRARAG